MESIRIWSFVLRIIFAFTVLSVDCLAGAVQPKAVAAVAVARAQLQVALDRPELPDSANRLINKKPRSAQEALVAREGNRGVLMSIASGQSPLNDELPAQLVIGGWRQGCPACRRIEKEIHEVLGSLGWTIGHSATDQIRFVELPQTEAVPQIGLWQNGIELKKWNGYRDPAFLSHELRRAWDQAPHRLSIQHTGIAGSIHGTAHVRQILNWFRENMGESVKAEVRWDRSGAQSFPLLANQNWSALALFGGYGHFQLRAVGAKSLPIDSIGFGYRIESDDIILDADAARFKGLATQLGFPASRSTIENSAPAAASIQPSGVDPLTFWTVLSIVRDIWSILHPSCDLILGGNVTATAVLQGDAITIEFQQCPSIRLVALFTFNLSVQQIVITETNVHVEFGGSRLVKSRDFRVE